MVARCTPFGSNVYKALAAKLIQTSEPGHQSDPRSMRGASARPCRGPFHDNAHRREGDVAMTAIPCGGGDADCIHYGLDDFTQNRSWLTA
jgi:hypothetical protein